MDQNANPNPSKFTGLHRFAELVTQAVKCEEVADALPLRGTGKERFCPKCQANAVHPVPYLILSNKTFECANCHSKGDVIDLVMITKLCSLDDAVKWLADYLKMDSMTLELHESHASDPSQSEALLGLEEEELRSRVRREYLKMCRALPEKALGMLTEVGISSEALKKLDVHYPPRRMVDIINDLRLRFSRKILKSSGLFFSPDPGEADPAALLANQSLPGKLKAENSLECIFRPYDKNKIRYLIIPYYEFGRVVYVKARPVVSADLLRKHKLPKFIATSNDIPCLYNVDALSQGGPIIVFRNELDVMAAVSVGFSAVACSALTKFNPAWIMLLAGRHIWFYDDGEPGTDKALTQIEAMFSSIGQKRPGRIARRSGEALVDAIRRLGANIGRPIIEPPARIVSAANVTKKTIESIAEDLAALDPHPEENSSLPAASSSKQLLASIPIETGLQLVVYTFRHDGTSLIRLRYQRFMKQTGQWKDLDTPVMTFDTSIAGQLIDAIERARRV